MITQYVLGFLFKATGDLDMPAVALIRKNKPAFQKDMWNGIGGKIELGETSYEAMRREFFEETGQAFHDWQFFCLYHPDEETIIHCFRGVTLDSRLEQTTDEFPFWVNVSAALVSKHPFLPNVRWLIPMALHDYNIRKEINTGRDAY